ncbi:EGF-like domain-containing protein [Tieghemostelium lacteum]|uniref:EGF-like domain-containing protein n=1 Tax=Tieghemostelium lacteum TaxID=361077 RepID=A0A151ZI14_TIELA|nr:EGF-like domain-containing protein [Tieghemostelium lacteum]|eukprot:KYQ93539.1 EGF-like domain-containing protein [Tieghemostelium lacteum]
MKVNLILIFLITFVLIKISTQCNQDWECGNAPYTVCLKQREILPGLQIDKNNGNLLLLSNFKGKTEKFICSLAISGGNGNIQNEFQITSDIEGGSGFRTINRLYAYLESSDLVYTRSSERLSAVIAINYPNGTYNPIWYPRGFNLGLNFDETNQKTYSCEFDLVVYNKLITNGGIYGSEEYLYRNGRCQFLGRVGQNLYLADRDFSGNGTVIRKGVTTCRECQISQLTTVHSSNRNLKGFTHSETDLYYSDENAIYRVNINSGVDTVLLSQSQTQDLVYHSGYIYFTTMDHKIFKLNVNTLNSEILYDGSSSSPTSVSGSGSCACSPGFKGAQCNQCDSGNIIWSGGFPECINLDQNGFPSKCLYDWQCSIPYGYCSNSFCQCRSNFYGNQCQSCDGTVSWNSGFPTCAL